MVKGVELGPCGFFGEPGIFVVVMIDRGMFIMRISCALLETKTNN